MNSTSEIRAHKAAAVAFRDATWNVKHALAIALTDLTDANSRAKYRAARDAHETARLALIAAQANVTVAAGHERPMPFGPAGPMISDTVSSAIAAENARFTSDKALFDKLET
ncbi:hypothetical protein CH260_12720 [Rhodococcus sp. 05-2256-B2]|uniref:hypothetical protein n=1 Tax=unclassified Rhodococcus (in: high G+C Gram-positive bacteria) TaxID=192944 RepID=UPI000B9B9BE4|nr:MULTISPECIES: hypothetical protein [unclassified Rhodococcus (in: high G+C Gram-positive bacteria)]OZD82915.1 hypothetical protein CH258_18225 [Rhodococcus sp. 05-2256-B4]OZD96174.1 hypothetical protein CH260_12720 [Rhodococcus sp. 05-2256-B2]OZD96596.1 hypothetical protein CH257_04880 [Rhodococcus sp. 05-2256-B3]OZD99572.1 hypothetical protein CH285_20830 [Rhodococcus sp. 05-2256-B1]